MGGGSVSHPVAQVPAPGGNANRRRTPSVAWNPSYGLAAAIVLAGLLLSLSTEYFLVSQNLLNISRAIAINGIVAMAMTMLLISGSIDLSVAAVMSMSGVLLGWALLQGFPFWLAVLVPLGFGVCAGVLNGLLVNVVKINSIIVTLGTLFVWRGGAFLIAGRDEPLITDPVASFLGQGRPLGIPMPAIMLGVVFVLSWVFLFQTRRGAHFFAIGGDAKAAALMGLPVGRISLVAFTICGFAAALAGVLLAGSIGAALPYAAEGLELPIITAVILGGTALHGGRGSPVGTLMALVFLGVVFNGMTLLNVDPQWQLVVQGVALLIAVTMDALRERAAER